MTLYLLCVPHRHIEYIDYVNLCVYVVSYNFIGENSDLVGL
ncbi:hypothetical protein Aoki45_29960 [Algoriphagus sp. oki45]|nr:hypothetical protein Aoki45_29960 [Algoriphagus sp. oki45]